MGQVVGLGETRRGQWKPEIVFGGGSGEGERGIVWWLR